MNFRPISPFDGLIDLFPSDILWELRKRKIERGGKREEVKYKQKKELWEERM